MERPITPRERVLRCVTLKLKTKCEKRKQRIEKIKNSIIEKENARIEKWQNSEKTKAMVQQRNQINKQFLNLK